MAAADVNLSAARAGAAPSSTATASTPTTAAVELEVGLIVGLLVVRPIFFLSLLPASSFLPIDHGKPDAQVRDCGAGSRLCDCNTERPAQSTAPPDVARSAPPTATSLLLLPRRSCVLSCPALQLPISLTALGGHSQSLHPPLPPLLQQFSLSRFSVCALRALRPKPAHRLSNPDSTALACLSSVCLTRPSIRCRAAASFRSGLEGHKELQHAIAAEKNAKAAHKTWTATQTEGLLMSAAGAHRGPDSEPPSAAAAWDSCCAKTHPPAQHTDAAKPARRGRGRRLQPVFPATFLASPPASVFHRPSHPLRF